ncbi:MAG: hypothetical protein FWG10_05370 [Eubacteriaceae bacterium]|nr:hypothetical protein [Eubacteriaceae bacterium]
MDNQNLSAADVVRNFFESDKYTLYAYRLLNDTEIPKFVEEYTAFIDIKKLPIDRFLCLDLDFGSDVFCSLLEKAFDNWALAVSLRKDKGLAFFRYIHELADNISQRGYEDSIHINRLIAQSHLAFFIRYLNKRFSGNNPIAESWEKALPRYFDDWSFARLFLIYIHDALFREKVYGEDECLELPDRLIRCICIAGTSFLYRCILGTDDIIQQLHFNMALRNYFMLVANSGYYKEMDKLAFADSLFIYLILGSPGFDELIYNSEKLFIEMVIEAARNVLQMHSLYRINNKRIVESLPEVFQHIRNVDSEKLPYCKDQWSELMEIIGI